MKSFLSVILISFFITSCSGEEATIVEPVQKNDKQLSCEEILFEINDSEYYIKQANEKKSLGVKSIVMPLGYIDTYMTADEAISAAKQRISYLKRIYDIRNCDEQVEQAKLQQKLQKTMQQQMPVQPIYPYNNNGYPQQY